MNEITNQTRQLSFDEIKPMKKNRYKEILDNLLECPKTAREIAVSLYNSKLIPDTDRNNTGPRLTELEQMGLVKAIDKKRCSYSKKKVAVYKLTKNGDDVAHNKKNIEMFFNTSNKPRRDIKLQFEIIDFLKCCLQNAKEEQEEKIWRSIIQDEKEQLNKLYITPARTNV